MVREPISQPAHATAPLDEILADFEWHGVRPTWLNIIAAALDAGHDPDFAAAMADAAARRNDAQDDRGSADAPTPKEVTDRRDGMPSR